MEWQVHRGGTAPLALQTAPDMRSKLASKPGQTSPLPPHTVIGNQPGSVCVKYAKAAVARGGKWQAGGHSDQGSEVTQHGLHSRSSRETAGLLGKRAMWAGTAGPAQGSGLTRSRIHTSPRLPKHHQGENVPRARGAELPLVRQSLSVVTHSHPPSPAPVPQREISPSDSKCCL